ncbi:hypothetical protein [Rhodococcus sp. IEGM 1341]|uniref:hypothetical protein n=1 Tax=Rhodococcus sp. IEGM 1341 TaxID=3047090 RepID=UPI0024B7B655|nr:hypothetical protein [Rhodococcus sp. IEGM 1341]MDI9924413.1 hypothetical protein [Rhodococcus sp. IEGM 1341]
MTAGLFCLSGVKTYTSEAIDNLDGVPEELDAMRKALAGLGLTELAPFTGQERSHQALQTALHKWARNGDSTGRETLVIYCTGHGMVANQTDFHLVSPNGNVYSPELLLTAAAERASLAQIVLILDACFAGQGADSSVSHMRKSQSTTSRVEFWAIASSQRLQIASQRTFAYAFVQALQRHAIPSWSVEFLNPADLASTANSALGNKQSVWIAAAHSSDGCRALPNPSHQPSDVPVGLPMSSDWAGLARGVSTASRAGAFFTGRKEALHTLRQYVSGSDARSAVVVTGTVGSGKSALLGHLVLTATGSTALTSASRLIWPKLSTQFITGWGTPSAVIRRLAVQLGVPGGSIRDVASTLKTLREPITLVLDQLAESRDDSWGEIISLAALPDVRMVLGVPIGSALHPDDTADVIDLDEHAASTRADVRAYLELRFRLAHPDASESTLLGLVDDAEGWGPGFAVAVAGCEAYVDTLSTASHKAAARAAMSAATNAARKICRAILRPDFGENGGIVIDSLAALCSFDDSIAVPAREWAAVASASSGSAITTEAVAAAGSRLAPYVEHAPGPDGIDRWRSMSNPYHWTERRGLADMERAEYFLAKLPQLHDLTHVDWSRVDPSVQLLVAWVAALESGSGRLLDDPDFLLNAPAYVVSAAIRRLGDIADRTRRSLLARVVPPTGNLIDRAFLLDMGAHRFELPVVSAAMKARYRPSHEIGWMQSGRPRAKHFATLITDATASVAVTVDENDTLEFWDTEFGQSLRPPVRLAEVPFSISVARLSSGVVALVSTWQGQIWSIACDRQEEPILRDELVPQRKSHTGQSQLQLALHDGGTVFIAVGGRVWSTTIDTRERLRSVARIESDLHSIVAAGSTKDPSAWIVTNTGRIRRLQIGSEVEPPVSHFPMLHSPLLAAASRDGAKALVVDAAGGMRVYSADQDALPLDGARPRNIRAAAVGPSSAVVAGGPIGGRGWMQVHSLSGSEGTINVPLDEPPIGVAVLKQGDLLVARPSGLLTVALNSSGTQSPLPLSSDVSGIGSRT